MSLKHGDTIEQVNLGISWARDDIDNLFKKVKTGTISKETFNSKKFKWSNLAVFGTIAIAAIGTMAAILGGKTDFELPSKKD